MSAFCDEMEAMGKGIGNASRFRVLEALMQGPRTVGDVVKIVKLSQPGVSQHLKVLKAANLVTDTREGQEVYYSVNVAYMAKLLQKLTQSVGKNGVGKDAKQDNRQRKKT